MDLIRLMNDLNDDTTYRFHLAKTEEEGGRSLDALVHRGKSHWSYRLRGLPVYVHLNGLAMDLLKKAMKSKSDCWRSWTDVKHPLLSKRRTRIENQHSI